MHRGTIDENRWTVGNIKVDNAMAEALNSLFKAECIRNPVMRPRGGWLGVGDVEWMVAECIDLFDHRRLRGEIDHVPTAEVPTAENEAACWSNHTAADYGETPVLAETGTR